MRVFEMGRVSYYATAQEKEKVLDAIRSHFHSEVVTYKQIQEFVDISAIKYPRFILSERKVAPGKFNVGKVGDNIPSPKKVKGPQVELSDAPEARLTVVSAKTVVAPNMTESFIPEVEKAYVPFGFHNDMKNIIKSKIFFPMYITGLSGNGKTLMVEQVCASLKREMIRVNITRDTDETDLIGSYELIDGNTVRREGPVIVAMKRGAVLLIDETDLGTERLLCLQPILEGKPYFDKKTGESVFPAEGFNIIATANTKGKGSDDGRFIGTNVLNEAFLERFAITVEQQYPAEKSEKIMLKKHFESFGIQDDEFVDKLVLWANVIRKSFDEGAVDEIISTRRLVHIVKAFSIFKNRVKAIQLCLNRFDNDTKVSFLDLYTKVDQNALNDVVSGATPVEE
jgi:MoxR-like ATPase